MRVNNLVDFRSEDNDGLSASHKWYLTATSITAENLYRNLGLGSLFLSDTGFWLRFRRKTHLFSSAVGD